jgi:hypothetical protein
MFIILIIWINNYTKIQHNIINETLKKVISTNMCITTAFETGDFCLINLPLPVYYAVWLTVVFELASVCQNLFCCSSKILLILGQTLVAVIFHT